jgi:hypothetical protein
VPQQSNRSFVPPHTGSVKKSISVKEYMEELHTPVIDVRQVPSQTGEQENIDHRNPDPETLTTEPETLVTETELLPLEAEIDDTELFLKHWKEVIDLHFQKQPTVYFTLKEYQPEITNNTIYLTVKNELQKEEIEEKKRVVIAYLRNHYKNEIEDIEILVNEEMESKVKLLDERDKLKLLHEQNSSLADFMKILNMNLKE